MKKLIVGVVLAAAGVLPAVAAEDPIAVEITVDAVRPLDEWLRDLP